MNSVRICMHWMQHKNSKVFAYLAAMVLKKFCVCRNFEPIGYVITATYWHPVDVQTDLYSELVMFNLFII